MNDSVLVEALRARDPGALAALYDTYAERLYTYAWAMLGSTDGAQVVLRDTLIAAEAHIDALADPERLRIWLYALARGECLRRRAAPAFPATGTDPETDAGADADAQTIPDGTALAALPDGDLRPVAMDAVAALPEAEREALDLLTRHRLPAEDLAAVLGTTAATADEIREAACAHLQDLVSVLVLARDAARDCPDRTCVLAGSPGPPDHQTRDKLVEHAGRCLVCGPYRDRQVSVSKVFDLLARPVPPETLRVRVMSCFIDPELVPYRGFVARRTGLLGADGFPVHEIKEVSRRPRLLAGAVAAVAIVIAAVVLADALGRADGRLSHTGYGAFPVHGTAFGGGSAATTDPVRPSSAREVTGGHGAVTPAPASPGRTVPGAPPVVPPTVTSTAKPPRPPRGHPPARPSPTADHQRDPWTTSCRTTPPALSRRPVPFSTSTAPAPPQDAERAPHHGRDGHARGGRGDAGRGPHGYADHGDGHDGRGNGMRAER